MFTHSAKLICTFLLCLVVSLSSNAITLTVKIIPEKSLISFKGVIGSKDYPLFNKALKKELAAGQRVILILNSGGGNFSVALKIAERINKLNKQAIPSPLCGYFSAMDLT